MQEGWLFAALLRAIVFSPHLRKFPPTVKNLSKMALDISVCVCVQAVYLPVGQTTVPVLQ